MHLLIDFLFFLIALPALFVFVILKMLSSVVNFFGWSFFPGVLGLYTGNVLLLLGRPDPHSPWENIFQMLAGIQVFGFPFPYLLLASGVAFLAYGAISRLKNTTNSGRT